MTDIKYEGYLKREQRRAEQTQKLSHIVIPSDFNFRIPGISNEVAERLELARPPNLATAAKLPGITPAAIDTLVVFLGKQRLKI